MRKALLYGVGVALAATACAAADGSELIRRKPDQEAIVKSAQNDYTYDPPLTPKPAIVPEGAIENSGVLSSSPLTMTIARARLKDPQHPDPKSQVLAMIYSKEGYQPMHIPQGYSYLWRNKFDPKKGDKKWNLYIVPQDLKNTDVKKWKRWKGEVEFSDVHLDSAEPHLVYVKKPIRNSVGALVDGIAYGGCIEDQTCPANHCGYGAVQ